MEIFTSTETIVKHHLQALSLNLIVYWDIPCLKSDQLRFELLREIYFNANKKKKFIKKELLLRLRNLVTSWFFPLTPEIDGEE